MAYFGQGNSYPALEVLYNAGFDDETLNWVNRTMAGLVRMPYSNNWRVEMPGVLEERTRRPRRIEHDCPGCTTPARSGRLGRAIADVVGWTVMKTFLQLCLFYG